MSKKGIIISILVWLIFLIVEVAEKYSFNQIIYVQTECLAIILAIYKYKIDLKKYRNLPIKELHANFLKTTTMYIPSVQTEIDDNGNSVPSYYNKETGYVYEYELNGKKHKYTCLKNAKENVLILYYRKGISDITDNPNDLNRFPIKSRLWRTFLICPGSAIITVFILYYIFKIQINF